MYVHNEPVAVEAARSSGGMSGSSKKTISSSAVQKPISLSTSSTGKKNEIFVDILERLTVLFNANVRGGGGGRRGLAWHASWVCVTIQPAPLTSLLCPPPPLPTGRHPIVCCRATC